MKFQFKAVDSKGVDASGTIEAPSYRAASSILSSRGLRVSGLVAIAATPETTPVQPVARPKRKRKRRGPGPKFDPLHLATAIACVAVLVTGGQALVASPKAPLQKPAGASRQAPPQKFSRRIQGRLLNPEQVPADVRVHVIFPELPFETETPLSPGQARFETLVEVEARQLPAHYGLDLSRGTHRWRVLSDRDVSELPDLPAIRYSEPAVEPLATPEAPAQPPRPKRP